LPIRAYALCILAGVAVAIYVGDKRWVSRGGRPGTAGDIAVLAVPFGLVGARLYHVMTDPELYFGKGGHPVEALYIWRGGLGIWGAIGLGAVGGWVACRIYGIRFPALADALAPGIVLAQALGRWGNWFNQELFGKPTSWWWGLRIDPEHRPPGYEQYATFQPTFLFESIWDVGTAIFVIVLDRRLKLGHGRAFALYVMAYTAGRGWIEYLRIDTVNHVLGLRLNVWTSIVVFALAAAYFVVVGRLRKGREVSVYRDGHIESDDDAAGRVIETGKPAESTEKGKPAEKSTVRTGREDSGGRSAVGAALRATGAARAADGVRAEEDRDDLEESFEGAAESEAVPDEPETGRDAARPPAGKGSDATTSAKKSSAVIASPGVAATKSADARLVRANEVIRAIRRRRRRRRRR
jgi:prolipoprotein diacylglyceryl transferase